VLWAALIRTWNGRLHYFQEFPANVLSQEAENEEGAAVFIVIPINKLFFFRKG
jgi:hypothetical protein